MQSNSLPLSLRCQPTSPLARSLRAISLLLLTAFLSTQTGCQIFQRFGNRDQLAPVIFDRPPTQDQLLAALQRNVQPVKQLNSTVKISLDGTPKLKGSLQLERPKRMRVKAGVMRVSELGVDVGSNDQLFWVWTKANVGNQHPAIFYASHDAFRNSSSTIRRSIPLEPVWLIEGLGMIERQPTDVYHGPYMTNEGLLKLLTVRQTANGPQTRVSLIDSKRGLIQQQAIYDANNDLVAYTNSLNYKYYEKENVNLPQRLEMYLYQGEQVTKMIVEAGEFEFNSLYGDPNQMWAMPNPEKVPKIDLTRINGNGNQSNGIQVNGAQRPPTALPNSTYVPRGYGSDNRNGSNQRNSNYPR
jgi:hypothetical protein